MDSTNYIYQIVHTLSHHPLHVDAHCRVLEESFMEIYFRPIYLDAQQINNDIIALLKRERVTCELSVFVEIRIDIEGEITLHLGEVSIYDGYTLRCIKPTVKRVFFDSPFGQYHTSIRRQTVNFANTIAENLGGELAAECNSAGVISSIGGGAVFGVMNRQLIASTRFMSVERKLIIDAAQSCKIEVVERVITHNDLMNFDELLLCDHYGITAVSRYEKRSYMSTIADKIAEQLATPWISLNSI